MNESIDLTPEQEAMQPLAQDSNNKTSSNFSLQSEQTHWHIMYCQNFLELDFMFFSESSLVTSYNCTHRPHDIT